MATINEKNRLPEQAEKFSENFHGFLEVAPDAVAVIDKSGNIVQFNRRAEILFGYGREEVLSRSIELLMPSRFRTGHVAHRMTYNNDMRPRSMGSGLDLLGAHKDGREFPIDVMLSPLDTRAGVFVACAVHDMTIHRKLEDELRRQARELEAVDRQKDHFVAMIMHELRGPLSVLTSVGDLLRMPEMSPGGREKAMVVLERQTTHMIRLVNDLLDVAKVREGQLRIQTETFDLRTVVVKAIELSQAVLSSGVHELRVEQSAEPLIVDGDPVRLTQVVSNLLINAGKYTPKGGRITVATRRKSASALICVQDNGEGIPVHMLHRVFDLFAQVERPDSPRVEGMGIGLALVQRLVHLHSGTVTAASEGQGCGSLFTVCLPLAARNFPAVHH